MRPIDWIIFAPIILVTFVLHVVSKALFVPVGAFLATKEFCALHERAVGMRRIIKGAVKRK